MNGTAGNQVRLRISRGVARWLARLCCLLACAWGSAQLGAQTAVQAGSGWQGQSLPVRELQEFTVATSSGSSRKYLLALPDGAPPASGWPLVLALHGGGGHAAHMADDSHYGLVAAARREGFAIVFPNGFSRLPGGRLATWNAGDCCGAARDTASDDVGFLRAVVNDVARQWPLDARRVFATGMSNGAMMAYRLACEAPDLVRAIAAVAGTEAVSHCQPGRAVPVLHLHALDDDHVLFGGGAGSNAFRDRRQVMEFTSVPETLSRWVQRNACPAQPQVLSQVPGQASSDSGVRCERYSPCAAGSLVQLCTLPTGGHAWPGAPGPGRFGKPAPTQSLDANRLIFSFFREVAP